MVAPALGENVSDGSQVSVRFGRPLKLTVDGKTQTHWVTATSVASALGEIGQRFAGADLSTSRGGSIDRRGLDLSVITPKTLVVKIRDQKPVRRAVTALTATDALRELGVKVTKGDVVTPRHQLRDGDHLTFTDVRVVTSATRHQTIGYSTVHRSNSALLEGHSRTVRSGRPGVRDVTYRLVFRNGHLDTRRSCARRCVRAAGRRDHRGRHQAAPAAAGAEAAPAPAPAPSVELLLRQQRLGPDRRVRVGWQLGRQHRQRLLRRAAVQPRHLAGLRRHRAVPTSQPRDQIAIAEKVRDASGGYGAWPAARARA